ncbi:hypothetical protein TNCV_707311 [Trichonephila clavipes]|nr:hypothetical protein TNCV_707311 [Trichonephila clavipes]
MKCRSFVRKKGQEFNSQCRSIYRPLPCDLLGNGDIEDLSRDRLLSMKSQWWLHEDRGCRMQTRDHRQSETIGGVKEVQPGGIK